jgi:hypothetical protein
MKNWNGCDKYEVYVAGVGYVGTCNTKAEAKSITKAFFEDSRFAPAPGAPKLSYTLKVR